MSFSDMYFDFEYSKIGTGSILSSKFCFTVFIPSKTTCVDGKINFTSS